MKKLIVLFLTTILCIGALCACSGGTKIPDTRKNIVCTIFPEYDWTKELIKGKEDEFNLSLLLDNGVDLHNYQPTAEDMIEISTADLLIYVGGESDGWIEDAIKNVKDKDIVVVNLLELVGEDLKEEELVEGMRAPRNEAEDDISHEGDAENKENSHGNYEEAPEYDEHVWLSLRNAKKCVQGIESALREVDFEGVDVYTQNANQYIKKLEKLDAEYEKAVSNAKTRTILFGDRFPFRYLTDDYGLKYYAAFLGCSAETEASFETITFLSSKMDELGLGCIFVLENSDDRIAKTIINNTKMKEQKIIVIDSLQSVTKKEIESGATYLGIMEDNLLKLKEALD